MTAKRVVHRRYSDKRNRPDLRELVLCNNINGPIPGARLTSRSSEVTCGRCKRIISPDWKKSVPSRPLSEAHLRRISRDLAR